MGKVFRYTTSSAKEFAKRVCQIIPKERKIMMSKKKNPSKSVLCSCTPGNPDEMCLIHGYWLHLVREMRKENVQHLATTAVVAEQRLREISGALESLLISVRSTQQQIAKDLNLSRTRGTLKKTKHNKRTREAIAAVRKMRKGSRRKGIDGFDLNELE